MGVTPELFVSADKGTTDPLYPSFSPLTVQYAYKLYQEDRTNLESLSGDEIYDVINIKDFLTWAALRGYHMPNEKKDDLIQALHLDIAKMLITLVKGTEEMHVFTYKRDPFIAAAQKSLTE